MPDQRLLFAKTGRARFISHLDLMRTFQRAFLRAGIPIRHTEGFHPHAFVSIALPLSVGYASQCELLDFGLLDDTRKDEVPERLNAVLPEGIRVLSCGDALLPVKSMVYLDYTVAMEYGDGKGVKAAERLTELLSRPNLVIQKRSKKAKSGFTEVDLIPLIRTYSLQLDGDYVTLYITVKAQDPGLNPALVMEALTTESPTLTPQAVSYQRVRIRDKNGEPLF